MPQFSEVAVRTGLVAPDGSIVDQKGSKDGLAFVQSVHGKYSEAAKQGRLFHTANTAAVTTTADDATTWTGLGIANPDNSGKLLVLLEFSWALTIVGSDDGMLGLMSSDNSGFADVIAPQPARLSVTARGGSVALVDDGATLVTPKLVKPISTYGTGAVTTWQGAGPQVCKLDGQIIIPPGMAIATITTTVVTAGFQFGFLWEEVAE